jgi:hypothetical protein
VQFLLVACTMESPPLRRKLVLYFDVNETLMVGDPAGGDSFEDCLNKMICKNAFVRLKSPLPNEHHTPSLDDYEWHDGTPLSPTAPPPPLLTAFEWPEGCHQAYSIPCFKQFSKHFTESPSPGIIYRPLYEELKQALSVAASCSESVDSRLTHNHDAGFFLVRNRHIA